MNCKCNKTVVMAYTQIDTYTPANTRCIASNTNSLFMSHSCVVSLIIQCVQVKVSLRNAFLFVLCSGMQGLTTMGWERAPLLAPQDDPSHMHAPFYTLGSLRRPRFTGEKPFKCVHQGCSRSFWYQRGPREHENNKHGRKKRFCKQPSLTTLAIRSAIDESGGMSGESQAGLLAGDIGTHVPSDQLHGPVYEAYNPDVPPIENQGPEAPDTGGTGSTEEDEEGEEEEEEEDIKSDSDPPNDGFDGHS